MPACGRLHELDAAGCSRLRTVACPSEALRIVSVHACAELVVRPLVHHTHGCMHRAQSRLHLCAELAVRPRAAAAETASSVGQAGAW